MAPRPLGFAQCPARCTRRSSLRSTAWTSLSSEDSRRRHARRWHSTLSMTTFQSKSRGWCDEGGRRCRFPDWRRCFHFLFCRQTWGQSEQNSQLEWKNYSYILHPLISTYSLKMGQSQPLFWLFSSFPHDTNQYKFYKKRRWCSCGKISLCIFLLHSFIWPSMTRHFNLVENLDTQVCYSLHAELATLCTLILY